MPEQPPKTVEKLADHINELESLIDARKTAASAPDNRVPILDDVVGPDADAEIPAVTATLEDRLLRRVEAELAELGQVVRQIIRRCIREEFARGPGDDPSTPNKPGDN